MFWHLTGPFLSHKGRRERPGCPGRLHWWSSSAIKRNVFELGLRALCPGKACGGGQGGCGAQRGFGGPQRPPAHRHSGQGTAGALAAAPLAHPGAPGAPGRRGRGLGGRHVPARKQGRGSSRLGPLALRPSPGAGWGQEPGPAVGSPWGAPSGGLRPSLRPSLRGTWGEGQGAAFPSGAALGRPQAGRLSRCSGAGPPAGRGQQVHRPVRVKGCVGLPLLPGQETLAVRTHSAPHWRVLSPVTERLHGHCCPATIAHDDTGLGSLCGEGQHLPE